MLARIMTVLGLIIMVQTIIKNFEDIVLKRYDILDKKPHVQRGQHGRR